jgi:Recombinase
VYGIFTHPKYIGCHAYGRTSCRLYTPSIKLPRLEWILTNGAFEPVVDKSTFWRAQQVLVGRTFNNSNVELLDSLRSFLPKKEGCLCNSSRNRQKCPPPPLLTKKVGSPPLISAWSTRTGFRKISRDCWRGNNRDDSIHTEYLRVGMADSHPNPNSTGVPQPSLFFCILLLSESAPVPARVSRPQGAVRYDRKMARYQRV